MKVLQNLLIKTTIVDDNHACLRSKIRGENALSTTYHDMSESAGKRRKKYAGHLKDISKLICLIHGSVYSSDECKSFGYFGYKYYEIRPSKDRGQEPAKISNFKINLETNYIFQNAVYEIILYENNKLSTEDEAHQNINTEMDENDIYK